MSNNFLKKMNRKNQKQNKKSAVKEIKKIETAINNVEKMCSLCYTTFDVKKNPEQLDSWHVKVFDDHVELFCDVCFDGLSMKK